MAYACNVWHSFKYDLFRAIIITTNNRRKFFWPGYSRMSSNDELPFDLFVLLVAAI